MLDVDKLVKEVKKLKKKGFNNSEISGDLHLSVDTVCWLLSGAPDSESPPSDVKIGWRSMGVFGHRIKAASTIISSIIREELGETDNYDTIMGIAINGIPYATLLSDILGKELAVYKPEPQPLKGGHLSSNFAGLMGKKVIIIDDVISTGNTLRGAVTEIKKQGGEPVLVCTLVNKTKNDEVQGCPLRALIRTESVGGTVLGGGPIHSFPYA